LDKKARIIFVRLEEVLNAMADQDARVPSTKRFHIVLVPGFAGFDGLGQLEYYGCITRLFQTWLAGNEVLHYFDNFPTAAVVTRATQLRSYLAKRIARGEMAVWSRCVQA
jgi:triacylglycerol lipase